MEKIFQGKIENYKTGKIRNTERGDYDRFLEIKFRLFDYNEADVAIVEAYARNELNELRKIIISLSDQKPDIISISEETQEDDG